MSPKPQYFCEVFLRLGAGDGGGFHNIWSQEVVAGAISSGHDCLLQLKRNEEGKRSMMIQDFNK